MNLPWSERLLIGTCWFAGLWCLTVLLVTSQGGTHMLIELTAAISALVLLSTWVILLFFPAVRRSSFAFRVAVPMFVGLGAFFLSLGTLNPLFYLRFELSRPALTAFAESAPDVRNRRWVGLFPVRRCEVSHGQVRILTAPCGVVDSCGLVYSPGQPPEVIYEDHFFPLGQGWYHVHEGF